MKRTAMQPGKRPRGRADRDEVAMGEWRFEVFRRAGSRCKVRGGADLNDEDRATLGKLVDLCEGWAQHAHHIAGRDGVNAEGRPLRTDPDNGLACCHSCHLGIVHGYPEIAYRAGWMIRRNH